MSNANILSLLHDVADQISLTFKCYLIINKD